MFLAKIGERNSGMVDRVPGIFHLKTRFFSIFWFPVMPLASYLVLTAPDAERQKLRMPLSGKSVFAAGCGRRSCRWPLSCRWSRMKKKRLVECRMSI